MVSAALRSLWRISSWIVRVSGSLSSEWVAMTVGDYTARGGKSGEPIMGRHNPKRKAEVDGAKHGSKRSKQIGLSHYWLGKESIQLTTS
jgi:hypothetical protein